jgi:hypothetical protein
LDEDGAEVIDPLLQKNPPLQRPLGADKPSDPQKDPEGQETISELPSGQ